MSLEQFKVVLVTCASKEVQEAIGRAVRDFRSPQMSWDPHPTDLTSAYTTQRVAEIFVESNIPCTWRELSSAEVVEFFNRNR